MIDLNHICLFLALASPFAVLVRSLRPQTGANAWRIASALVLAVTGVGWVFARAQAGFIGAGAWFVLLFLPAVGLKRMSELTARQNYTSARKLAVALRWLHPSADLLDQIRMLRYMEKRQAAGELPPRPVGETVNSRRFRNRLRSAPVVILLIAVNIIVFVVELLASSCGLTEGDVLLRLGALQPALVLLRHEYWRIIAALFLHAGLVHLLFNLFALYVLGPPFERAVGSIRFLACYLLAGISSSAGVVVLWRLGLILPNEVVGASGCVMGIVGAWAAFLIRDHQTPLVRRRLTNIVMIVLIQTAFDLTTPQVSMSAHLCGLIGGFLVGLVVSPKIRRKPSGRHMSWSSPQGAEADRWN